MRILLVYLIFLVFASAATAAQKTTRIAFGSCLNQEKSVGILDQIRGLEPELFIFLGDNIYGDGSSASSLEADYKALGLQVPYKRLRSEIPILATWDDHDYGKNDGGAEYPLKMASERLFLDFFEAPETDERRKRPGIYKDHWLRVENKKLHIVLLDTRYFRSPLKLAQKELPYPGKYEADPDPRKTFLGSAQWTWLKRRLKEPADFRIIVSSIQVLHNNHGWEKWGNFPKELKRLKGLVRQTGTPSLFLSGDRHRAGIYHQHSTSFDFYEVTASPLNETLPKPYRVPEESELRLKPEYFDSNFGTVELMWGQEKAILRIHRADGVIYSEKEISLK